MRFSGTLGGGYTFYDSPDLHIGDWNANASALLTIDNPGFNLQANFSNDHFSAAVNGGDDWNFGGDAYWRDYAGAIGLDIDTHAISNANFIPSGRADFTNFGFFGQWFVVPEATLEIKGGWMQGQFEGPYAGAGVVGYPLDSVALELTADYAKANHLQPELKDIGLNAEFLPLPEYPVSVSVGYTRAEYRRLNLPPIVVNNRSTDVFGVAIKVYFGGGGGGNTLRDYHRNGPVHYDSAPAGISQFGF
ncbi:MAG TPA: hypothetical protein VGI20_00870 [Rhizomicrobium sp.]